MKHLNKNNKSFSVPSNYFETLEDNIMHNKVLKNSLGYTVPDNYFNHLNHKISNKSTGSNVKKLFISITSIAASIIIILTVYFSFFNNEKLESLDFVNNPTKVVDDETEHAVYESLYKSYFIDDSKKSSNEITLDDMEEFYADR